MHCLCVSRVCVKIKVCCSVSNDKSSKVVNLFPSSDMLSACSLLDYLLVPHMNLIGKIWSVNSSIRFASNEQFVLKKLWETIVKISDCREGIFWSYVVGIPIQILMVFELGIAHTCWWFKIKNICTFVPWLWVFIYNISEIIYLIRTMLLNKPKHRGTARATIEPDEYGIFWWLAFWFHKYVV